MDNMIICQIDGRYLSFALPRKNTCFCTFSLIVCLERSISHICGEYNTFFVFCHKITIFSKIQWKNPAYGTHWISQRVRIVAPIHFFFWIFLCGEKKKCGQTFLLIQTRLHCLVLIILIKFQIVMAVVKL